MIPDEVASQLPNYRRIEIWVAVGAVLFLVLLFEAIRRRRLKERYALLWVPTAAAIVLLTVKRQWLESISFTLGIHHAPSALLLVLVAFAVLILFHYSTVLSRLLDDRTALVQRVALLDARCRALHSELRELRAQLAPARGDEREASDEPA